MFGHQDEPQQPTNPPAMQPAADEPIPDAVLEDVAPVAPTTIPPMPLPPVPTPPPSVPQGTPLIEAQENDGVTTPSAPPTPAVDDNQSASVSPATDTDQLLDIKQQALQQLSPLVGHLDQTPEEKFRTTMMMIQAADNQDLIGQAYQAAQAITDEKARAQALLDIVNEINYFTQRQAK